MPIYEYECGKCGVFEQSQRISEPALTKCPTCRRKVRRLISSTSFQLKGTGWYVTDYARAGADGKKGKDGGDSSSSESSSSETKASQVESKSESNPNRSPSQVREVESKTKRRWADDARIRGVLTSRVVLAGADTGGTFTDPVAVAGK
jgi:putative FmdB family regulatory protein